MSNKILDAVKPGVVTGDDFKETNDIIYKLNHVDDPAIYRI